MAPLPDENTMLLWHVIQTLSEKPKINWAAVAKNMGLKNAGTANMRYTRLRWAIEKQLADGEGIGGGAGGVVNTMEEPTVKKKRKRAAEEKGDSMLDWSNGDGPSDAVETRKGEEYDYKANKVVKAEVEGRDEGKIGSKYEYEDGPEEADDVAELA